MKSWLLIGHNDVRIMLKNRSTYVWLLVAPLLFITFMGSAIHGPGDPRNYQPPVQVENRDTNFLGEVFLRELSSQGIRVVRPADGEPVSARIIVPEGFTSNIVAGYTVQVELSKKEQGLSADGAMAEIRLIRSLIGLNSHLLRSTQDGANVITEAGVRLAQASPATVRLEARFAGRKPSPVGFGFSLPGNLVMYVMMNVLIFGGASLSRERQTGILRRLACQPSSRNQLVAGKIYGLMLLGLVQIALILLAGKFLFKVNLGANLAEVLVVLVLYAWVAAALGTLVGSIVRAEDKVVGICVLASLLMAALGGCWWPLEIVPAPLKVVAGLLPTGWALSSLHQLITFGGSLVDCQKQLGLLAGTGLAASLGASRYFRL